MRYVNTKTGAVVDIDAAFSGGDWVLEETYANEVVIETETIEVVEEVINDDDNVNFEEMKKSELQELLDKLEIEYTTADTKDILVEKAEEAYAIFAGDE